MQIKVQVKKSCCKNLFIFEKIVSGQGPWSQSNDFLIYYNNASAVVGLSVFKVQENHFFLKTRYVIRCDVNFYHAGVVRCRIVGLDRM
jgi:hypothetical protein